MAGCRGETPAGAWAQKESVCPVGTGSERVPSGHFAEGESELEVACSTSEVHDSAPRANGTGGVERLRQRRKRTGGERFNKHRARQCRVRRLNRVDKNPNATHHNQSESERTARRAMRRATAAPNCGRLTSIPREAAPLPGFAASPKPPASPQPRQSEKMGQGRSPWQGAGVKPLPGLVAPKESVCPVGTSPKAKANWR